MARGRAEKDDDYVEPERRSKRKGKERETEPERNAKESSKSRRSTRSGPDFIRACNEGDEDTARKFLREPGFNPNVLAGSNPGIVNAAINNHWEIVRMIIRHPDFDPRVVGSPFYSDISGFLFTEHAPDDVMNYLIDHHARGIDLSEFLLEIVRHHREDVLHHLGKLPAFDFDRFYERQKTVLDFTIEKGDTHYLKLLLAYGARKRKFDAEDCIIKEKKEEVREILTRWETQGRRYITQLRKEVGISDRHASELFAFIIFHCENLLEVKEGY